jgi:hypothetical protein
MVLPERAVWGISAICEGFVPHGRGQIESVFRFSFRHWIQAYRWNIGTCKLQPAPL